MRRIGSTPQQRGSLNGETCPDVFELDDGGFVVIGKVSHLTKPEWDRLAGLGASVGDDESAVIVPRNAMLTAARQLVAEDAAADSEAQGAYKAYGAVTDFLNFRGDPMPAWEDLPARIRAAWMNAALGVRNRALMQASDKIRDRASPLTPGDCGCEPYACNCDAVAASIDPHDPRSLDE